MSAAATLLELWDRGRGMSPARRACLLANDTTGELPLGAANVRMCELRVALFGSEMACLADCPACGMRLEASLDVANLIADVDHMGGEQQILLDDGTVLRFRLPRLADLEELGGRGPVDAVAMALLNRCLLDGAGPVPTSVAERVTARMAELDPMSECIVALSCGSCGTTFSQELDIAQFLWREIEAAAMRALAEVHVLASAYGWREAEILALPSYRRQAYLDLIGA